MNDLTCAELVELVTEYLEGSLTAVERRHFEAHLDRCAGCASYLEQMRQTIRLTGLLSEQTISAEAKQDLLRIFRDWWRTGQDD